MMRRIGASVSVFFVLAAFAWVRAGEPNPRPTSLDLKAIDTYLEREVKDNDYPGLALAILNSGKVIFSKGYGTREWGKDKPVTADTVFAVGSVSKQFACAAILLLAEDGKLSIDDTVAKYYPRLARASDITIRRLMNHTSGYPDYYPLDFLDRRMAAAIDPEKLLETYAGGKLDFEPGERWSYSNTGYVLLGRIAERVSGEPLGSFLDKRVFQKLGMTHTSYCPENTEGHAQGHRTVLLGPPEAVPVEGRGWLEAAGGVRSTVLDLIRWDLALMEGRLFKPESFAVMTAPGTLKNGAKTDYGCGLVLGRLATLGPAYSHSGAVSGFLAYNEFMPESRSAVVVLGNGENVKTGAIGRLLVSLLIKDRSPAAAVPRVEGPKPDEAALELFRDLQAGKVDRAKLGEEFGLYLSDDRVHDSALRLKKLGEPQKATVLSTSERGAMEVTQIEIVCKEGTVQASMFRSPGGKIEQFLLRKP